MRESLTILAVLLILLLSALLVGPYLINWNNQRDWLAAKLSDAVGARVRIAGPVDVKLLPRPIFRAGSVSIEGATRQDPRVTAARLDAELSINSLLQGAIEFVDAHVAAPRIEVTLRPDGSIVAPAWDVRNPQKIQFTHVNVSDGTVAIKDEAGADRFVVDGITAQGEAETLFGPLKLNGTAKGPGGDVSFRLTTGAYGSRKIRARLLVDGADAIARADADGVITLGATTGAASGHAPLVFEGIVNAAGNLHIADGAAPVPWRIAMGSFKADAQTVSTAGLEVRAGVDGRAIVASGGALLALGAKPAATVQLRARQLDLDILAVAPEVAPDTPRPRPTQWLTALQTLIGATGSVPVRLSLNAGIDAVTTGDQTFTNAVAALQLTPGSPLQGSVSMAGPNGSRLALDGVVEPGAAPAFKGRAEAETRDIVTAATWIEPFWPGAADWIAKNAAARAVAFKGQIGASRLGLSAQDVAFSFDGSSFGGVFSLKGGNGGERPLLSAELSADTLETERLPDLGRLAEAVAPLDLSLGITADAVKLARLGADGVQAGRLAFHLTKRGDDMALDQFSITGLDGVVVTGTASLNAARHLQTSGHAQAKDVVPLAALVRQFMPGTVADAFAKRAPFLSPMDLAFKLEGAVDSDTTLMPTLASGSGTFGATTFSATLTPEPAQGRDDPPIDLAVTLDEPDTAALLRQAGLSIGSVPLGAAHVEMTGRGTPKAGFETKASATLAAGALTFAGYVEQGAGRGRATAGGRDAVPLMKAIGWAGPSGNPVWPWSAESDLFWGDGTLTLGKVSSRINGNPVSGSLAYTYGALSPEGLAAPVLKGSLKIDTLALADLTGMVLGPASSGDDWSSTKFPAVPSWPRAEVALRLGSLSLLPGLVARDAAVTVALTPTSLSFGDVSGHILNGIAGGTVVLRRDGPSASLSGQITFDDVALALPSLTGRLSGTLNLAGTGSSPDGLIGSIAGEGTLSMTGASMPRFDPRALLGVASAFDKEGVTIDDDSVRDALLKALDRGPLNLGDVSTPVTIAAGTLRIVGLTAKGPSAAITSEGGFNFRGRTLVLKSTLASTELPKDWKGDPPQTTVVWSGPLLAPSREVDAAAFVNGLAARAIARDQERIELMQDDIRERAFFARRLKAIEAEQQAARDAIQIQKMMPPPPRPGDIRMPKAPDVAPSSIAPGPRSLNAPRAGGSDDLTKLIDSLQTVPLPPAVGGTRAGTGAVRSKDGGGSSQAGTLGVPTRLIPEHASDGNN